MITMGAINITMPSPHSPQRYIEMFKAAYAEARKVELQGDWVGLLGQATPSEHPQGGAVVRGEFYKYIDLDSTREWYNVISRKPADRSDLEQIVIPEQLKPHFQFLPFIFFARGHRLICVTKDGKDSLSIRQVASILRTVLGSDEILKKFGKIDVTIEPSLETLDEILQMPKLRKLELDVTRPNPDDFDDFEQDFLDDMEKQKASSMRLELVAEAGQALVPNSRTKMLAKVAQSNGKVVGTGGDRGETRTLSTAMHPFEQRESYLPDLELLSDVILEKAFGIFKRITA